jgi:maleate cis-trans isomerase
MRAPWRRARPPKPPLRTVRHEPAAAAPAANVLEDIEAQALYHRERLALYRARMQGAHPTSADRLVELERAAAAADDRLATARRQLSRNPPESRP